MKRTDCIWEKRNLGDSVVEFTIDNNDSFKTDFLKDYDDIDYLVVKVPVNRMIFNEYLARLGFVLAELQMEMSISLKDFDGNNKLLKYLTPQIGFQKVANEIDFANMLSRISPMMFTTDRVSLDSHYGVEIGCSRYKNWMIDEYNANRSSFLLMYYRTVQVGFIMYRESETTQSLLGGIYQEFQDMGLGVLTVCGLPLYFQQLPSPIQVKKITANISSNNKPVWELYERFGFKVTKPQYVFFKHNKISKKI